MKTFTTHHKGLYRGEPVLDVRLTLTEGASILRDLAGSSPRCRPVITGDLRRGY